MSVADGYSLAEDISRGIDCAMREAIECEEKADLLIKAMGGEAFDYVARLHGYVKERTCHCILASRPSGAESLGVFGICGECGGRIETTDSFSGKCEEPDAFCRACGAKVVE